MAKVLKVVSAVTGVIASVARFIPGVGTLVSAIATGISIATAIGSSLLAKSKAPRNSAANTDRLRANVDPRTPRKSAVGVTALPTDIRDEEFTDDQEQFHRFIVCASHKVQSIDEIWFDDELAWSDAGGIEAKFFGYLGVETYAEGSAGTAKNISPRMGTTRRFTGLAWVYLRYKLTGNDKKAESPFAQSITTRITIRGRGALLYDPRSDSTVPGGSGTQRAATQSTWVWNESACRNPALALLFYLLGWRINGVLAVGKGIPANRIDLPSFAVAANICDELVTKVGGGTEPRYRCDGAWSEGDDPSTVIDMLKATMNADLDDVDGKLRLTVFHNDLATPVADFTEDDVLNEFDWTPSTSLQDSFNIVRGSYTDPSDAALYQMVDYPIIEEASADGIDRPETVDLPMVQSAGQAQRLGQLRLQRQKYGGTFVADFQATAWKVQKNSVIRLTFAPLGFVNKLFRVAEMSIQVDGIVPLVLREENTAIYGAPSLSAPVSASAATTYDYALDPFLAAANLAESAINPGGTIKTDKVLTGSIAADAVTGRYFTQNVSAVTLTDGVEVTILSLTVVKLTDDSEIDLDPCIRFSSSDDIRGTIRLYRDATLIDSFAPYINGGDGTFRVSQVLPFSDGAASAGTYVYSLKFQRNGGASTVTAAIGTCMRAKEFKR